MKRTRITRLMGLGMIVAAVPLLLATGAGAEGVGEPTGSDANQVENWEVYLESLEDFEGKDITCSKVDFDGPQPTSFTIPDDVASYTFTPAVPHDAILLAVILKAATTNDLYFELPGTFTSSDKTGPENDQDRELSHVIICWTEPVPATTTTTTEVIAETTTTVEATTTTVFTDVGGEQETATTTTLAGEVKSEVETQQELAFTGSDTMTRTAIGAAMLALGAALVAESRRRKRVEA